MSACFMVGPVCRCEKGKEKRREAGSGAAGLVLGRQWAGSGWLAGFYIFLTKLSSFLFSVFKTEFKKQGKTFYKNLQKYFLESFSNMEYYGTYLATK